jgi:SAM-dependent MidA family methyltransferase
MPPADHSNPDAELDAVFIPGGGLPAPDAEARHRAEPLAARIRDEIRDTGRPMDFSRFMELALYAPGRGYYAAPRPKFGAAGDFVTAPELSPVFAACVAEQCAPVLDALGGGDILEAGGGSGRLAAGVLAELERLGSVPGNYFILELSAALKAQQRETLSRTVPHLLERVNWLERLPEPGLRGVVLGNEVLDAMPVSRFRIDTNGPQGMGVGWADDRFVWQSMPLPDTTRRVVEQRLAELELPVGYESEINLHAEAWVRSVAEVLDAGLMLLIDYGFPRREYYHPQRDSGTLMCHYQHRAHSDPLILVGLQDITAHVEFTAIAEAGHAAGLSVLGYTSQAGFLLGTGLPQRVEASAAGDVRQHLELSQQVKKLTLPSEMGELFKVMALGRGVDGPLAGFAVMDQRGRL